MEVFAGHLQPIHQPWIPAPYRGTGHASDRRNDEFGGGNHSSRIGVRDMLSYQSPMPAGGGAPGYENRGADWWRCLRVICNPYTNPGCRPRIGVRGMLSIAGVSVLDVKGFQVAGE